MFVLLKTLDQVCEKAWRKLINRIKIISDRSKIATLQSMEAWKGSLKMFAKKRKNDGSMLELEIIFATN